MGLYAKSLVQKYFFASEAASEIFSKFDAYETHLKSILELELFYGDKNLKEIILHTKDMKELLKKYKGIYSFTQPEIEEILREETFTKEEDGNQNKEE